MSAGTSLWPNRVAHGIGHHMALAVLDLLAVIVTTRARKWRVTFRFVDYLDYH